MMRISSLQLSLIVLVCIIVSLHAYRLYGPYESYPSYNNRWHRVTKSQFGPIEAIEPRPGKDDEYLEKLVRYLNLVGRK